MTDTSNYRVVAHKYGNGFDIVHKDVYTPQGCGETILTTQNVSVQTLTDAAHRHSLVCKQH